MMRLARRATLLLAVSLLTSAATAYAEYAWVLWNEVTRDGGPGNWILMQAESTKHECQLAADRRIRQIGGEPERMRNDSISIGPSNRYAHRYVCFPDSVDPRGSKASSR
jgi:hypothetical protein